MGSACFETCETKFRCSICIRQGGVDAPVLWRRVAKYVLWKWRIVFGVAGDDKYLFSGMMWAGNFGIFSHDKENPTWMVNDIIKELMDLDMEPEPESL